MSIDPTRIDIVADPTLKRMKGIAVHGNTPFDVPFISKIGFNLWQGGCETGLELPKHIKHVVSLYPWERYETHRHLQSELYVEMYDSTDQAFDQVDVLAQWINLQRKSGAVLVHCFPDGTQVGALTPTDITKTTQVLGIDGRFHDVTYHHLDHYSGDLIKLVTTGALDVTSTPEHPFLVMRPYYFPAGFKAKPGMKSLDSVATVRAHNAGQPTWVKASDVRVGDYLVSPKPVFDSEGRRVEWAHPAINNARSIQPLTPTADIAWMIGLFAADGGTEGEYTVSFTLSKRDNLSRLVAVWESLGLLPRVVDGGNYWRVAINSSVVARSFREWFGKSTEKRLPEFIFTHGFPLSDVLAGYVEGDGYEEKDGTITCHSISQTLIEQIRMLALSIELSPTVSPVRRHSGFPNAKPAWKIQWREAATQRHTTWWNGLYLMPVTSVSKERYDGDVHNISVEGVETYTVNGALVHNCQAGLNRSSLVAARTLFNSPFPDDEHLSDGTDIVNHLRDARSPAVLCNPAFRAEVESWA